VALRVVVSLLEVLFPVLQLVFFFLVLRLNLAIFILFTFRLVNFSVCLEVRRSVLVVVVASGGLLVMLIVIVSNLVWVETLICRLKIFIFLQLIGLFLLLFLWVFSLNISLLAETLVLVYALKNAVDLLLKQSFKFFNHKLIDRTSLYEV
jgi:hypothetical protein